jgi:hypothetical protein
LPPSVKSLVGMPRCTLRSLRAAASSGRNGTVISGLLACSQWLLTCAVR